MCGTTETERKLAGAALALRLTPAIERAKRDGASFRAACGAVMVSTLDALHQLGTCGDCAAYVAADVGQMVCNVYGVSNDVLLDEHKLTAMLDEAANMRGDLTGEHLLIFVTRAATAGPSLGPGRKRDTRQSHLN